VRSVGGSLHALSFGTDAASYYAGATDEVLVVLQMESARSVENAEELLGVPGIDAVFIGPNDLMASLGMTPGMESDDRRFVEALEHIRVTAQRHGVAAGIHVANHEAARRRINEGFRFIALASDLRFMLAAARDELTRTGFDRGDAGGEVARY
jgi:4-hydroxy-2-oxoheptanedioate aldolase